jgi:MerR HTH family regulatory protein
MRHRPTPYENRVNPMETPCYVTLGTVAERLSVPRWKLAYLIERGDVPGPSLQVPGRRLFTDEDVARISAALALRAEGRERINHPDSSSTNSGKRIKATKFH